MLLMYDQNIYERITGLKHKITVLFTGRRCYEVRLDDQCCSEAETMARALDKVVDILAGPRYTTIKPL